MSVFISAAAANLRFSFLSKIRHLIPVLNGAAEGGGTSEK